MHGVCTGITGDGMEEVKWCGEIQIAPCEYKYLWPCGDSPAACLCACQVPGVSYTCVHEGTCRLVWSLCAPDNRRPCCLARAKVGRCPAEERV